MIGFMVVVQLAMDVVTLFDQFAVVLRLGWIHWVVLGSSWFCFLVFVLPLNYVLT